jgi:hypothetical protein
MFTLKMSFSADCQSSSGKAATGDAYFLPLGTHFRDLNLSDAGP